jgi:hypothetical protein
MWAQAINTTLGLWLMLSPYLLEYGGMPAMNQYTIGPLIGTIAFVSMWEVLRGLRWINVALGAWLVFCPLLFEHPTAASFNTLVVGLAIMILAPLASPSRGEYDGGWRMLWRAG